jgi:DNA polymerase III sliding clamp (beta) subunit (PCNA family)
MSEGAFPLLDAIAAREAAEQGIAQAAENKSSLLEFAKEKAIELGRNHVLVTADDVQLALVAEGISEHALGNAAFIDMPGCLFICRKLTGSFPNYQLVIPKNNDRSVTFDVAEALGAVKRASMMAGETTSRSLAFQVSSGEISITAKSPENGEADERIEAEYEGDGMYFSFQFPYLLGFLNVISDSKKCSLAFGGPNDPALFSIDETYRYILMPQRAEVIERERERAAEKAAA